MLRITAIFIVLISASASASQYFTLGQYLRDGAVQKACDNLVVGLFSKIVDGDYLPLNLGSEFMFSQMLEKAGVAPSLQSEFAKKILPIRDIKNSGTPELDELNRYLDLNAPRLFTCILPKGCSFVADRERSGRTAAYYVPLREEQTQYYETVEGTPNIIKSKALGLPRAMDLVVLNHPLAEDVSVGYLSDTYFHELRHFIDYDFLSTWIKANQVRMNRGLQPDALFAKYIEIEKLGEGADSTERIKIEVGFIRGFMESSAYKVGLAAHNLAASASDRAPEIAAEIQAFKQIAVTESGKRFLATFGIDAKNLDGILDVGREMRRQMQPTIDSVQDRL